jgi:hypothetical protein
MKRRSLFLSLAVAVLTWGVGALEARAGVIPLPTTLDQLTGANGGNSVVTGLEPDTFANFTYSTSPVGSPPAAADVTVKAFGPFGNESGITLSGAFAAQAGTTVDYALSFTVTAPVGSVINDATLSAVLNLPSGTTGNVSIGESIFNAATGALLGTLTVSGPSSTPSDTINFAGVNSILVQKDILIFGGSGGAGVSIINQGFSSTGVPEPSSMALLGIGMTGFLAFRRLFKRHAVA